MRPRKRPIAAGTRKDLTHNHSRTLLLTVYVCDFTLDVCLEIRRPNSVHQRNGNRLGRARQQVSVLRTVYSLHSEVFCGERVHG